MEVAENLKEDVTTNIAPNEKENEYAQTEYL